MPQKKIEIGLSRRLYPKKSVAAASGMFKDFIEITVQKPSSHRQGYEIRAFPGVCAEEAVAEFFNFMLGSLKDSRENQ